MSAPAPEFDAFSRGYTAGMEDPVKAALGGSAATFLLTKIDLLRRELRASPHLAPERPAVRMLDFGCGAGDFLALLAGERFRWQTEGCDVSPGMLAEARARHPELGAEGRLWLSAPDRFPAARYDVITAVCVFHHIPPGEWVTCFAQIRAALRPGGRFFLLEHNPWNPVTRWAVSRCEIDRDAVLLSPRRAAAAMRAAGLVPDGTHHFLFLPPRWRFLGQVERPLAWLPLGGQYCITARVP